MKFWLGGFSVCVLLIAGVLVLAAENPETIATTAAPDRTCPTEENFNEFWNEWSLQYINDNPYATVEMQMEDWNYLVNLYECGDEWLDPLSGLIEQHGASGTQVYWYTD